MLRPLLFCAAVLSASACTFVARAQEATIEIFLKPDGTEFTAYDLSSDGKILVGDWYDTRDHRFHPVRWTEAEGWTDLSSIGLVGGHFYGVSGNGQFAVGWGEDATDDHVAIRWSQTKGLEKLPGNAASDHYSAYGVANDGATVGKFSSSTYYGFIWRPNGTLELALNQTAFSAVTPDGQRIAGAADFGSGQFPTRWTGLANAETIGDWPFSGSEWADLSSDGSVVVGNVMDPAFTSFYGYRWTESQGFEPLTLPGADQTEAVRVSSDGRIIVGHADYEAHVWIDGVPRSIENLLEEDYGLDLEALGWTGLGPATAISGDGTTIIGVGDQDGFIKNFRVKLPPLSPPNEPPTVNPIAPVTLECEDGDHSVGLSTIVSDPDDASLTVTWKVDGTVAKTHAVASGASAAFVANYEHGAHAVVVEVSDGEAQATAGTTVTVHDTAAPLIAVAADVVVGTDAGEAFATDVVLSPPETSDVSGHEVTLESDAPSTYPLGETIVLWTATDADGNDATATQKVIVEDREKPTLVGTSQARVFVDPGKTYSTIQAPTPSASDNVDDSSQLIVTSDAKVRYPIGNTQVTFRVQDGAGNEATFLTTVTVVNRKPKANAGKNVAVTTSSDKGAKVTLDGSRSSDPDAQKLTYAWSAKKVKLSPATSAKPSGLFPVGTTKATLTVTDPAGMKHVDTVQITVKLKNGAPRPRGREANDAFREAERQAGEAIGSRKSGSEAASLGLAYATAASRFGDAAGECVQWNDGETQRDATLAYGRLRTLQHAYGEAAANALVAGFEESGDERLLAAALSAAEGTSLAGADLQER